MTILFPRASLGRDGPLRDGDSHAPVRVLTCVMGLLALIGCTETTVIRTNPPGAALTINNEAIGTTPVVYTVPSSKMWSGSHYRFRLEREGYQPEEGELRLILATGRTIGAFFTLGIVAMFRPLATFEDRYDVDLLADPAAAALKSRHLRDLLHGGQITEGEYEQLLRGPIDDVPRGSPP